MPPSHLSIYRTPSGAVVCPKMSSLRDLDQKSMTVHPNSDKAVIAHQEMRSIRREMLLYDKEISQ